MRRVGNDSEGQEGFFASLRMTRWRCGAGSVGEEGGRLSQEEVELVVVDPVAGAGDLDQAALCDGLVARILVRKRQKAFQSPEEQRGAGDLAE